MTQEKQTVKMIADQSFPTLQQLFERMKRRTGQVSLVAHSLIHACAEEAERAMLEQWRELTEPKPEKTVEVERKQTSSSRKERNYCSNCQSQNIYNTYNFCPKCGVKLQWITPMRRKEQKAAA